MRTPQTPKTSCKLQEEPVLSSAQLGGLGDPFSSGLKTKDALRCFFMFGQAIRTSIRREDLDLLFFAEKIGELALYLFVPSSAPNTII